MVWQADQERSGYQGNCGEHDDLPCPADPTGHSSSTTTRARGAFDTTGGEEAEGNFGFAAVADSPAEIRHCLSGEQLAI